MALAIDASTPARFSTATAVSIASPSFTPPAGALLLIAYGANNPGNTDTSIVSITNTVGTAVTYTRRARKNTNATSNGGIGVNGGAEFWTGVAPGGAITMTITGVSTGSGADKSAQVYVLTGADTTNLANVAAASSTNGLPSVTVPGCTAGSHVFSCSSDWAQAGLGTAGTGQTITSEYNLAGQITMHAWRTTTVLAAGGSQTMNLTAPPAENYNQVAIEIRDASGAPAATTLVRPRAMSRVPLIRASTF